MKSFISLITPVFNRLENIKLVYQSLLKQTIKVDEWIIADDGSTDGLENWVRNTCGQSPFHLAYLWLGENKGYRQGRARNHGAKVANKKALAYWFIDSDVLQYPNNLKLYKEAYSKNPNRVICGEYDWGRPIKVIEKDVMENWEKVINETLPPLENASPHGMMGRDIRAKQFEEANPDDMHFERNFALSTFGGNLLVPTKIFWEEWVNPRDPKQRIKGFDDQFTVGIEDGDFGLMTIEKGYPVSLHNGIKGYHLYHPRDIARITQLSREQIPILDHKHGIDVERETEIVQREEYNIK